MSSRTRSRQPINIDTSLYPSDRKTRADKNVTRKGASSKKTESGFKKVIDELSPKKKEKK